eukprot:TRINITY_DN94206_c0_g1_i1.p1 TRINITY_DN94206_c0_g1~~TRINITY_DN94206_c0_g1_i1.p1  ORF type:complete len:238 (-),score=38.73 TRINITY_DN94206_c0_g1_i1:448-1161(-)
MVADAMFVYWPALFSLLVILIQLLLDPSPKDMWPPTLDFSGAQAVRVISSPLWLSLIIPMILGLIVLRRFSQRHALSSQDHGSMVWWLTNLLWFHTGCDILSGYFQVMPVMTDFYNRMTPAHSHERWHETRNHLDAAYMLELCVEAPLCAWVLYLFWQQDPGRHVAEVFTAAVQLTGTVTYYFPGVVRLEAACWLSHIDRLCGSIWILFPLVIFRRTLASARKQGLDRAMQTGNKQD